VEILIPKMGGIGKDVIGIGVLCVEKCCVKIGLIMNYL
jgi:hypothetical protein